MRQVKAEIIVTQKPKLREELRMVWFQQGVSGLLRIFGGSVLCKKRLNKVK